MVKGNELLCDKCNKLVFSVVPTGKGKTLNVPHGLYILPDKSDPETSYASCPHCRSTVSFPKSFFP